MTFALAMPVAAIAANYNTICFTCGNSNDTRSKNTLEHLRDFNGALGAGLTIKIGDTVTVSGGDGSRGVYRKYSNHSQIVWGCVDRCGPGDDAEWFLPPLDSSLAGGGPLLPPGGTWVYPDNPTDPYRWCEFRTPTVCNPQPDGKEVCTAQEPEWFCNT